MVKKTIARTIDAAFTAQVCDRLRENRRIHYPLTHGGRLNIDRQLPFLCVYRQPADRPDEETRRLVLGEASYLVASGLSSERRRISGLVEKIGSVLSSEFGAFLLLEIWAGEEVEEDETTDPEAVRPMFRIHVPVTADGKLDPTCQVMESALERIRVHKKSAEAKTLYLRKVAPPGLPSVISPARLAALHGSILGLEVQPIYRSVQAAESFPLILRTVHRGVSLTLKRTFFEFTRTGTTHRPPHFHSLGQRAVTKAMWDIDGGLEKISSSFDFLLQVTPVNVFPAWVSFKRSKFERAPAFHYRPLPVDPPLLKKELYSINLDRIEDPTLERVFREKRGELDRQLTMLLDRGTPNFLLGSRQLYGRISDDLVKTSLEILQRFGGYGRDDTFTGTVRAESFAARAREELALFREIAPNVDCEVRVTDQVAGLMCSRGNLLVGSNVRIPKNRVEALIQHEVGTHLLTYLNGRFQPFQLLSAGLARYEEFQEGLAVFSEYLVGQLSRSRLRLLAARVVAARYIEDGATFVETFRKLSAEHGFEQRTAYRVTTRIYRGGGLTKDAIYLRGLVELLEYLRKGGDFEILFAGKLAREHIPIVRELLHRQVLKPPMLEPTYLKSDGARKRLAAVAGMAEIRVTQLVT